MSDSAVSSPRHFIDYCTAHHLPFAFYRLPEESVKQQVMVVAQKDGRVEKPGQDYSRSRGFLFSPFHEYREFSKVLIRPDIYTPLNELPPLDFGTGEAASGFQKPVRRKRKASSEEDYLEYIRKIKMKIWRKKFSKVVAARRLEVKRPVGFHPAAMFEQLCHEYPHAFVSLVFVPEYGMWMGASPELLLQVEEGNFTAHSLAGTKAADNNIPKENWGDKEKEEQQMVSSYIAEAFKKVTGREPSIAEHGTLLAGNVMHLQTQFQLPAAPVADWQKLVDELHPTPAVAGLPKKDAVAFILKTEISDRAFYSGFLGPVHLDASVNLYVNLRCMQIMPRKLVLYVGAGITLHSKAIGEWKETNLKAQTLLRVVQKLFPQAALL